MAIGTGFPRCSVQEALDACSAVRNCAPGKPPSLFGSDVEIVEALSDCDFGRWSGARIDDLQKSEPEALQAWLDDPHSAPHGGESVAQLGERVAAWLTTLEATPGHIVAITHPFVIRAALMHVLQSAAFNLIDVEPLSAIELRFNGRWRLRLPGTDLRDRT